MKTDDKREGYALIAEYAEKEHTYPEFDSDVQSGLNLFALREDIDLALLEEILDRITFCLPAIRRIFSAPIIRLRDSGEILPVEAVRVVNGKTLAHISVHSELWSNIKGGELIPRKLMSIRHEDDYAIYENILFARTVDVILAFTGRNSALLRDMLYANREMHFNLLERENHPSYFLALGKLHTGYLRDYDKYLLPIERCFEKLSAIEHAIIPRLSMPVYKKCRKKGKKLSLKRTNIFRSHKDYRKLYSLAKYFSEIGLDEAVMDEDALTEEGYISYCSMLCVFAAGHFNFKLDPEKRIDFKNIDISGSFGGWRLSLKREGEGIALTSEKEYSCKIMLRPVLSAEKTEGDGIFADPNGEGGFRLSIYDIDSFRRIQQLILRTMVYADEAREVCPFCGRLLAKAEDAERYECGACRTLIEKHTCPETGKDYFATSIKHFRKKRTKNDLRTAEGHCYFRNITPIDSEGGIICPHCGEIH